MMKKLLFVFLVTLFAIPGFSQIKFGIKAGAATTTVPVYKNLSTTGTAIEALSNSSVGFLAGIFLRINLSIIYLQPEALYATNTYEYKVGSNPASVKQTFNRLDVPLLIGLKLGPIRINAGPIGSVQIGTPKAVIDGLNVSELTNSTTFGYQAGVGFDMLKKITVDIRYEGNLNEKFGDAVTVGTNTYALDSRQPSLSLSVGFMF